VAVFLAIGGLVFSFLYLPKTGIVQEKGILGGPAIISKAEGAQIDNVAALTVQDSSVLGPIPSEGADQGGQPLDAYYNNGAIKDPGVPIGAAFDQSGERTYTVQKGDTLPKIAASFGITADTIISANLGLGSKLRAGTSLKILPTSGVVYQTMDGDTLQSISQAFNISQDKIVQFNPSINFSSLVSGTSIIIPGGTKLSALNTANASLPNFNSEFIMPATGHNWGVLHNYNAVDIANSCGTPVVAAADGLVIPDPNIPDVSGGWNGGYGNFVLLQHSFGKNVETRYAHLEQIFVQVGDYVKQGQEIGLMGESGEATGCHVHFEVIGAQNPFAKQ
jgi:murein DD-endopeptidase MepM/ murein hydrolase activator NlpD